MSSNSATSAAPAKAIGNRYAAPSSSSTTQATATTTTTSATVQGKQPVSTSQTNQPIAHGIMKNYSYEASLPTIHKISDPHSSFHDLGIIDFGAERTHFNGNETNYTAQVYNVGSALSTLMSKDITSTDWLKKGGATQFNLLNDAELHYSQNLIQQLTLNPPIMPPPVISEIMPDIMMTQDGDDNDDSGSGYYEKVETRRTNNPISSTGERARNFNFAEAYAGVQTAKKGLDIASKFWNIGASFGESEALGTSVLEGTGGALEAGLGGMMEMAGIEGTIGGGLAVATEAIGGAAVVGVTVAGAEILAGAAVVGLGLYETYRAFGGKEDLSEITSGLTSAMKFGQSFERWIP